MIKKKISLLVFIWSALLFFLNLQYDLTNGYDDIIFWFSIIVIISIIIYQIFCLKYTDNVVLFEIFTVYLFLHLVYQVGYFGLRGSDSYIDYNFLKTILNNHNFTLGQNVEGWPMIHIFSSIISILTKIEPLKIAKFLPSFISSLIAVFIYLLAYTIYRDKRVALFSSLIYGTIPDFVRLEGLFIRESFAIFIMILLFYLIYVSKQRRDYRFALLSVLLTSVIVFSHHFTSFMIIILLGMYIFTSEAIPYFHLRNTYMIRNLTGRIDIKTISLVILIAVFSYWVYYTLLPMQTFANVIHEVTGAQELITYAERVGLGSPIITLKGKIIYYGFYFFHLLFALILVIKIIAQKNIQKIEDISFSAFFLFCGVYAFLALYFLGSLIYPERFMSFGWMFGIIPLVGLIINLKKDRYKKILIILLTSFIIFNLYNINPVYYTGNPYQAGVVATDKDYLIAKKIDFPEGYYGVARYYADGGTIGAISDVQDIEKMRGGKNPRLIKNFHNSSKLAVIREDYLLYNLEILKEKIEEEYLKVNEILLYKNDKDIDKIYDLGSIYVLKGGG